MGDDVCEDAEGSDSQNASDDELGASQAVQGGRGVQLWLHLVPQAHGIKRALGARIRGLELRTDRVDGGAVGRGNLGCHVRVGVQPIEVVDGLHRFTTSVPVFLHLRLDLVEDSGAIHVIEGGDC